MSKGYERVKRVFEALILSEKDKDKALEYLQKRCKTKEQHHCHKQEKEKALLEEMHKLNLTSQVEFIQSKNPKAKLKKVLKALKKNGNDQEKALASLEEKNKQARKEQKYKEKVSK